MTELEIIEHERSRPAKAGDRYAYGAAAIGEHVGLNARQVSYFFRQGLFGDAVVKFGHRTMVGDIRRLQNLAFLKNRK